MTRSLDWQAVAPAGLQLLATCPRTLSVWDQIILPLYCHILPALLPSGLCALGKCMGSLNQHCSLAEGDSALPTAQGARIKFRGNI